MDYLLPNKVADNQQLSARVKDLLDDDTPSYNGNGIAYFLAIFGSVFEDATNKLQLGETNLTESMQNIAKQISDSKDAKLKADNKKLSDDCQAVKNETDDKKREQLQAVVTEDQSQYKCDDSLYQSLLQAWSPVTQTDSDLTSSISQNNNTQNQIGLYIANILNVLKDLIKLA